MSTNASYDQVARYYDGACGVHAGIGPDAEFYAALAAETGGPVLELGCGTGRVLRPIAARGVTCVGVDASPAMLALFRQKPGAEHVTLACAWMETFDLGSQRFSLIYSAFRAFQHLDTIDQQLACLRRARAHLAPGGLLAFDVFNPRPQRMAIEHEPESPDLTFQHEGRTVRRFVTVTRDRVTQLAHVTFRYVEDQADETTTETVSNFTMRWIWRFELELLLRLEGFTDITLYGDFDRSPVGPTSPALIALAR